MSLICVLEIDPYFLVPWTHYTFNARRQEMKEKYSQEEMKDFFQAPVLETSDNVYLRSFLLLQPEYREVSGSSCELF